MRYGQYLQYISISFIATIMFCIIPLAFCNRELGFLPIFHVLVLLCVIDNFLGALVHLAPRTGIPMKSLLAWFVCVSHNGFPLRTCLNWGVRGILEYVFYVTGLWK